MPKLYAPFFLNFLKLISILVFQNIAWTTVNNEKISIEISSGKTKTTTFVITCNNSNIASIIQKKLENTGRFKKINCEISLKAMQTAGVDLFIKLSLIEGVIRCEIHDIMQKKQLEEFEIASKGAEYNKIIYEKTLNKIADHIYKSWTAEAGIFNTSIIANGNIDSNISTLMHANYASPFKCISPPIAYVSTIINADNHIVITKFCTKNRGLALFSYNIAKKTFYKILAIEKGSVFSPAIYKNKLYVSASNDNTTSVYSIADVNKYMQFRNFKDFEENAHVKSLIKIPNYIAVSINVTDNIAIFCSNKKGRSGIFRLDLKTNKKETQISSPEYSYYDPALFQEEKIAAIKTSEGKFHLVIIDLAKKDEKTLLSKYYLSKPCWSPCGNWIAVSGREKGETDKIILVHKSGKYVHTMHCEIPLQSPIWIKNEV